MKCPIDKRQLAREGRAQAGAVSETVSVPGFDNPDMWDLSFYMLVAHYYLIKIKNYSYVMFEHARLVQFPQRNLSGMSHSALPGIYD